MILNQRKTALGKTNNKRLKKKKNNKPTFYFFWFFSGLELGSWMQIGSGCMNLMRI